MLTTLPTRRTIRLLQDPSPFLNLETCLAAILFATALALQSAFLGSLLPRQGPPPRDGRPAFADRAAPAAAPAVRGG
jgi:hypothetical protein